MRKSEHLMKINSDLEVASFRWLCKQRLVLHLKLKNKVRTFLFYSNHKQAIIGRNIYWADVYPSQDSKISRQIACLYFEEDKAFLKNLPFSAHDYDSEIKFRRGKVSIKENDKIYLLDPLEQKEIKDNLLYEMILDTELGKEFISRLKKNGDIIICSIENNIFLISKNIIDKIPISFEEDGIKIENNKDAFKLSINRKKIEEDFFIDQFMLIKNMNSKLKLNGIIVNGDSELYSGSLLEIL